MEFLRVSFRKPALKASGFTAAAGSDHFVTARFLFSNQEVALLRIIVKVDGSLIYPKRSGH